MFHGGPMQLVGRVATTIDMQSQNKTSLSLKLRVSLNVFIIMNLGEVLIPIIIPSQPNKWMNLGVHPYNCDVIYSNIDFC
jgi:hypothetical protein